MGEILKDVAMTFINQVDMISKDRNNEYSLTQVNQKYSSVQDIMPLDYS